MTYHIEIRKLAINLILQHGIVKISKFLKISRITLWRWQSRGVDAIKRVYKSLLFEKIKFELEGFLSKLNISDVHFIPVSALHGDNIVNKSKKMPWYQGSTLMYVLENLYVGSDHNHVDCRFPVQHVIRPRSDEHHDYRGFAGRVAGGVFKPGDEVMVLPSGHSTQIVSIHTSNKTHKEAFAPMSVSMLLKDDVDISRGDMLVKKNNLPIVSQNIQATVCWLGNEKLDLNKKYIIKHATNEVRAIIKKVLYKINVNTLHRIKNDTKVGANDIARMEIKTTKPLIYDPYSKNRVTGSFIVIDEANNETVGAGMILG